jgi:hypothetical protein
VEKGQLGAEVQRRIIFIWEGAVAQLPKKRGVQTMESLKRSMKVWDQAVSYWQINDQAINAAWSLLNTADLRMDIAVTSRPPEFAEAVARLVERQNLPFRYVFSESAQSLGRRLPSMPDVVRVYYGDVDQRWAYGPHGFYFSEGAWRS